MNGDPNDFEPNAADAPPDYVEESLTLMPANLRADLARRYMANAATLTSMDMLRQTAANFDLWAAINEYAEACGGDTSDATVSDRRMDAVVAVERATTAAPHRVLALVEEQLQRVREGNTSYTDTVAVLERIAALLRGAT